jgi:hypothetical protein
MALVGDCLVIDREPYCTGDGGTLTLFINGQPNDPYAGYIPLEGDEIRIVYETNEGERDGLPETH